MRSTASLLSYAVAMLMACASPVATPDGTASDTAPSDAADAGTSASDTGNHAADAIGADAAVPGADADADAGAPSADAVAVDAGFVMAPHPPLPQVLNMGGKVLQNPHIRALVYGDDPYAADVQKLLQQIAANTYWQTVVAEYGVGALTVEAQIPIGPVAPAVVSEKEILAWLKAGIGSGPGKWGSPDPSTIYLLVVPPQTDFQSGDDNASCCVARGGYHQEIKLGATLVPFAVACACDYPDEGMGAKDALTSTIAHELIEAATDPFPNTAPAFSQQSSTYAAWTDISDGETADLCEFNLDSNIMVPGIDYLVTRAWSNKNAAENHEPCVPNPYAGPFFDAVPLLNDSVVILNFQGVAVKTKGVKIPVGQSATIDVVLFSDGPIDGQWEVNAIDYEQDIENQAKPKLKFSWDKTTGNNGDVLHLTIKVLAADAKFKCELFMIQAQLGERSSVWMGAVGR